MKQTICYQMDDGLNVTGEIPVSYDNFVFQDLEENIVFKKSNINMHYDTVMLTLGDSYKEVSKYVYSNILQAFKTIVDAKKYRLRKSGKSEAIAFLHQEMKFSPTTIQKILHLLEVKMTSGQILKSSNKVFADKPIPAWIQRFVGGNL